MLASGPAVVATAVASPPIDIQPYPINLGLSVKRVPGFLAGAPYNDLAAPIDHANADDRQIDNASVQLPVREIRDKLW